MKYESTGRGIPLPQRKALNNEYFKSINMSARKLAQAKIIAQIKIMLRICTCATVLKDYKGGPMTGKLDAIFSKIEEIPGKRVAIGVRQNSIVRAYAAAARQYFPGRPSLPSPAANISRTSGAILSTADSRTTKTPF